jgi:hypothetical protein
MGPMLEPQTIGLHYLDHSMRATKFGEGCHAGGTVEEDESFSCRRHHRRIDEVSLPLQTSNQPGNPPGIHLLMGKNLAEGDQSQIEVEFGQGGEA